MNSSHEEFEALVVKATDGCLSVDEQERLSVHLRGCEVCQQDLAEFGQVKQATDGLRQRILADVESDPIRPSLATRTINRLGFVVLVLSSVVALGYAGFELWQQGEIPWPVRLLGLTAGLTALLVFGNVLRLRLRSYPQDPYREIDQ